MGNHFVIFVKTHNVELCGGGTPSAPVTGYVYKFLSLINAMTPLTIPMDNSF
jgi:hypothetical protein